MLILCIVELRDLGTLNYKFSRDEESREKEMEALKRVHEETKQEHYFSEESKQKRQQKIRERLEKFRQSKAESSSEIITKQPEVIEDRDAEEFLSSVLGKQV